MGGSLLPSTSMCKLRALRYSLTDGRPAMKQSIALIFLTACLIFSFTTKAEETKPQRNFAGREFECVQEKPSAIPPYISNIIVFLDFAFPAKGKTGYLELKTLEKTSDGNDLPSDSLVPIDRKEEGDR